MVAEGVTLHHERFTREQLVTGSIYVPKPPEDPEPPKEEKGCSVHFEAFFKVLRLDRRLAKSLDAALRRQGSSLGELLECLKKCAGDRQPKRPGRADPGQASSVLLAEALRRAAAYLDEDETAP